eukprot:TRINITY_DN49775_c0_g1_i1.p1 TRINITY_DN49775_c0_g1~~TRINITY_DN49775_c0_g1_i1.p1  ORF type:complete len:239 (-),score=63.89 TRINITY_DN49775_c0_g1_i1:101-817(-)
MLRSLVGSEMCIRDRDHKTSLAAGFGLVLLQQLTGQPAVMYYAASILQDAGFEGNATLAAAVVAGVKLAATVVATVNLDGVGRRACLFIGVSMMAGTLVGLALVFQITPPDASGEESSWGADEYKFPRNSRAVVVICLLGFVSGYQVGFGPVTWVVISEVFPLHVRSSALGCAVFVNFGANLGMTYSYLPLMDAVGTAGMYWVYMGMCLVSLVYIWFLVPETKSKTLEQIEDTLVLDT